MKKRNRRNRVHSVPASPPRACQPHTSREPGLPRTCHNKKAKKETPNTLLPSAEPLLNGSTTILLQKRAPEIDLLVDRCFVHALK
jgi:hypothetical protein